MYELSNMPLLQNFKLNIFFGGGGAAEWKRYFLIDMFHVGY